MKIYGLPLTNNVAYMEEQIRETVGPFVKEMTEIKPLVHSDEEGDAVWGNEFSVYGTQKPVHCTQISVYATQKILANFL